MTTKSRPFDFVAEYYNMKNSTQRFISVYAVSKAEAWQLADNKAQDHLRKLPQYHNVVVSNL